METNLATSHCYTTCTAYFTPNGVRPGEVGSQYIDRANAVSSHPRKAEDRAMVKMLNVLGAASWPQ